MANNGARNIRHARQRVRYARACDYWDEHREEFLEKTGDDLRLAFAEGYLAGTMLFADVGHPCNPLDVDEVERRMAHEALSRSRGSKHGAGIMLGRSSQWVARRGKEWFEEKEHGPDADA